MQNKIDWKSVNRDFLDTQFWPLWPIKLESVTVSKGCVETWSLDCSVGAGSLNEYLGEKDTHTNITYTQSKKGPHPKPSHDFHS